MAATELVHNGDMENTSHWFCTRCHIELIYMYLYHNTWLWRLQSWLTTDTWRTRVIGSVSSVIWNWSISFTGNLGRRKNGGYRAGSERRHGVIGSVSSVIWNWSIYITGNLGRRENGNYRAGSQRRHGEHKLLVLYPVSYGTEQRRLPWTTQHQSF